jgi:hypothetical protein
MHAEDYLLCPDCAELRLVETPPCADGHGAECPERACCVCGAALFLDPSAGRVRARRASRHAA